MKTKHLSMVFLLVLFFNSTLTFSEELSLSQDHSTQTIPTQYQCFDQNNVEHTLVVFPTHVYLDQNIFLFKDENSQTVTFNKLTHSLFNNDDLDLVLPNSFIKEQVPQGLAMLVDYQVENTLDLACERIK